MEVLLFPVGVRWFALEARFVERVLVGPDAGAPAREWSLACLVPGCDEPGPARLLLRVGGRELVVRSGVPEGFAEVDPARLVPLPAFLFEEGRRLARAVFERNGRLHLLLDEAEIASRGAPACS